MKKTIWVVCAIALLWGGVCKKSTPAVKSVYKLFPNSPTIPATTGSPNCEGVTDANPLPAYATGKGWLPYNNRVFCNQMDAHWQQIRIPGRGKQDIKGCNYFLMPRNNPQKIQGKQYSNRYYPNESHFQSWFAVYAVAPITVDGRTLRVPMSTSTSLVRRDNIAWAQFMGDPLWRKLVGKPGKLSRASCVRKENEQCVLRRMEYDIPSHMDMGCCNWTVGPFPDTYKVQHQPALGCAPNPCLDSPTGDCGDPRKYCDPAKCYNCKAPIWQDAVRGYQQGVRHTIISYQWYIGDWLMVSIATGVVFKKKDGETVNTFEKFPEFKKELELMTRSITVYYDPKKPFKCSPTTGTDNVKGIRKQY